MRDSLKHYASPYYDPEYQHQYYLDHRELKGRDSSSTQTTSGSSSRTSSVDTQRNKTIEDSINRLKERVAELNNSTGAKKEELKKQVTTQIVQQKQYVNSLRSNPLPISEPSYTSEWYNGTTSSSNSSPLSGLNQEGRAIAREVKSNINAKRDEDIKAEKESLNAKIASNKQKITDVRNDTSEKNKSEKDKTSKDVKDIKDDASKEKDRLTNELNQRVSERNEKIKSRTASDKSTIEQIRSQIKALGKGDTARKEALQKKISEINADRVSDNQKLRDENTSDRSETKESKTDVSKKANDQISTLKDALSTFTKQNILQRDADVTSLRNEISGFRESTKVAIESIKSKASETYLSEVEKLKSFSKYQTNRSKKSK